MDIISVVVPFYNSEKTIERCVNSIQKQSYSDLDIIPSLFVFSASSRI